MENQKTKIISIASIIALALTLVTATFAYFMAQTGEGKSTDIKINANTVDTFTFEAGSAISLNLNQDNFASGKGNQTGTTFAKAMLTANNKTNTATEHYYMYLNISENTFTYTQNTSTPEILLTIKDGSGNEITSITGLTYKTNVTDGKGTSISGFDITTKSGLITLFDNREITTTSSKTEEWNITVTFVNYDADQSKNAGKSFDAKLMIQQENLGNQTLAEYVISQYTGTQGENSIYYHNSTLANGAGDNSYRYAGANPNNYVCFGSDTTTCSEDNLYRIIGVFDNQVKLIKATIAKSNLLGTDGAYNSDTSYQWSSLTSCPSSTAYNSNNGIYQLANKNTIAAADFAGCNEWHYSDLNKTNLNTNFVNNIGSIWADKIATTTWKVGGGSVSNIAKSVPKTAYQYEVGSNASRTTYEAKIGLMYVSDYYYGASASAWTLVGYDSSVKTNDYRKVTSINWLYLGSAEWTISRIENESYPFDAFTINSGHEYYERVISSIGARPTFNLLSSTTYVSGSGTMSDPIVIN